VPGLTSMDYQLLQLAAVYAEDTRVPRVAGPRHPSRSALSFFRNWIRRTIQRRRGYQRLQQPEDLAYLWLEDGPEDEPERTIFEPPEDLLPPGDVLSGTTSLLISLEQPGDSLISLDAILEPLQPRSGWLEDSTPQPDHLLDESVPSGLADPLTPVRTGACMWLPD
jgi:hypothetical protein